MFVGRKRELEKLETLYRSDRFEFVVIYGRRRVGKTRLITEFCEKKKTVFFPALESNAEANLNGFSRALSPLIAPDLPHAPVFRSFREILENVGALAREERLILAIDEYPWLAESEPPFSSLLQTFIDHEFKATRLFLILCGSSTSFMETQVLGRKSPLFGRRTAQFRVLPFDYLEAAEFHPGWTAEEKALTYGVTGGVPLYMEHFHPEKSPEENIRTNFLDPNSFLFEEPANLLKQELREPRTYNAILGAIAGGASRLNEIATRSGCESGLCSRYLAVLMELGIVRKERPLLEKSNRKTIYSIEDPLFRFWHRFIPENLTMIMAFRTEGVFERGILPFLPTYMGPVFERMCTQHLLHSPGALPFSLKEIGRWWGTDPGTRTQEEIDIVGVSHDGSRALFAECKYTSKQVGLDVFERLRRRSQLLRVAGEPFYMLFAKSGFSAQLRREGSIGNVRLVTLKDLYRR
ncbi:MAG: ATP-binding protein [Synergistaceae bacterium]|nr:ATP-binding protein [Synergistaceae bacterium]